MFALPSNTTILLVDDDPVALEILTLHLSELGFDDVVSCTNAHSALGILHSPDLTVGLVFCDLQMPEMDGVELIRHMAEGGYSGGVALISGEDARILQAASNLARMHGLRLLTALPKPITRAQLARLLSQSLTATRQAAAAPTRAHTPEHLRQALDRGELVNHYQPKVDLVSGRLIGMEALVRWIHPVHGLVPATEMIALAETHGMIGDLMSAVLSAALRQMGAWHQAGLDLSVAVNVSVGNLVSLELPNVIARAANDVAVPLSSLVLELTESQLMMDPLLALDILTRLRLKRVGLSIDDFGTGYSSLAQLRDVPFDELKLDRGFVHGAWQNASLRAIFESSVGLAARLGMKTVAEGVEDKADWDFVRQTRCDLAQGNFIGRPMPADLLPGWLREWEARRAELALA